MYSTTCTFSDLLLWEADACLCAPPLVRLCVPVAQGKDVTPSVVIIQADRNHSSSVASSTEGVLPSRI